MKKVYKKILRKILLIFSLLISDFSFSYAQHYVFYGLASSGGKNNDGVIYKYDPITGKYDTLASLDVYTGMHAWYGLTLANNGLLYGVTEDGGSKNFGTMFSFNRINNKLSVLINFDSAHTGEYASDGNCVMQARNGLLYGTTIAGGTHNLGVFYSYNILSGKDSVLFNFDSLNGANPDRTVVQDTNTGLLYGTTEHGGNKDFGVIYRYDPTTNKDTVLFSFDSTGGNGVMPVGSSLFMASNGLFYGMTAYGGSPLFNGTLYSFNPKTYKDTTLVRFINTNGAGPWISNLMQAKDGLLYGMTLTDGAFGDGVLFSFNITTNKQNILVNFNGTDGNEAIGDLVQDPDNGLLYGVTNTGGSNNMGVLFCYNPITGKDSVVVNFTGATGAYPALQPTLVKDTPTGVNGLTIKSEQLKIYPNPNSGLFTIQLANSQELMANSSIGIYNILGEEIYFTKLNAINTTIDISDKAEGIYLYRVNTENGDFITEGKFIIEK